MSSAWDPTLPSVKLDLVHDDRTRLWQKSREAFKYVYKHYRDQADWFLKADDDTFVVMENLKYFLRDHQPSKPIYFGYRLQNKDLIKLPDKPSTNNKSFASGGAGYVLSKEALERCSQPPLLVHAGRMYRWSRNCRHVCPRRSRVRTQPDMGIDICLGACIHPARRNSTTDHC